MRIAVIGGGPGGLYAAALAKADNPGHDVTVWERGPEAESYGFGLIFSEWSLAGVKNTDPAVDAAMAAAMVRWDEIRVACKGETVSSGGHGLAAMSRSALLRILRGRCVELGVQLRYATASPSPDQLSASYDLVIAADGASSATRGKYADVFKPDLDVSPVRYIWLGTDRVFDAFTLFVVDTPYGTMQVHAYPYGNEGSTFIVDMHDRVWRAAGFRSTDLEPGESDLESVARLEEMFADILEGHHLVASNSKWSGFTTVRNDTWRHGNVVLLGDAAHTAHFSIGPGAKLALEDAAALASCLREIPDLPAALAEYEARRKPVATAVQRAAQASLEWFEHIDQYAGFEPVQMAFSFLTRSLRVSYDEIRRRDPDFGRRLDTWLAGDAGEVRPPMFQPFRLRELTLHNRVVVAPMSMFRATDGTPGDFQLVHLGSKALGGAGLVVTEMVAVSSQARVTPSCCGMYAPEHEEAWRRIVAFVHDSSSAAIGLQLGHAGRKGAVLPPRRGADHEPLPEAGWELVAPSPLAYRPDVGQTPQELTIDQMAEIGAQFQAAALAGARAGFDLLELHCAHGYLLSSFISPLTNRRTDAYGGSLENRMRFPLEVFDAVRAVWPQPRPIIVRISATDWVEGGTDADAAVAIARMFADHGADAIHASTGQVVPDSKPAFGRQYQVRFAERIRNEAGIASIAVGGIASAEDLNSIIMAGRADLVALGAAHLFDPQWTLRAAADQGYQGSGAPWPGPFSAAARLASARRGSTR
ncbi:MAG: FAD-dependent monooxygenase [Jatrophihabitantaceae bacterium]